jgi:predicted phosphoribosyltransferase
VSNSSAKVDQVDRTVASQGREQCESRRSACGVDRAKPDAAAPDRILVDDGRRMKFAARLGGECLKGG